MNPNQLLFDHLYRGKVLHAQRTKPEDRWLASMDHSEDVVETMKEGARAQFPDASEDEILLIIRDRMNRIRRTGSRR